MRERIKTIKEYVASKDELYKIFEEMGVFEGVSFEDSQALYLKLEEMRELLLSNVTIDNIFGSQLDILMFPIVCRTYRTYKHLINSCIAVIRYVNENLNRLKELESKAYMNIGAEAEFCDIMAKEISDLKL